MSSLAIVMLGLLLTLALYAAFVAWLAVSGRRSEAAALVRFIPDCVVLLRRLIGDPEVPRGRKLVLVALVAYLLSPIDLVPDFIPVAGQLDDALVAALGLRFALRSGGPEALRRHWPGPEETLTVVSRLAFGQR